MQMADVIPFFLLTEENEKGKTPQTALDQHF